MTNAFSLFRSLIIYGICLPLAIFIGYLLANPLDMATYATVGLLFLLLTIPLFLRWHYPWLIFSWSASAGLFFLPGKPPFYLVMIAASISISVLQYVLNRNMKFNYVPAVGRPLLFLAAVVLITARFTGGIGLNVLGGGDSVGGKRYIFLLAAIVGFFALTAQKIPLQKAALYTKLFMLGAATSVIGNLAAVISPSFYFIFLIFPADLAGVDNPTMVSTSAAPHTAITRFSGLASASTAAISLLLVIYGMRGVLDIRHLWRFLFFVGCVLIGLFGGFRSGLIFLLLLFSLLAYLEGMLNGRNLPLLFLAAIVCGTVLISFSARLPLSVQRSLAFLPIDLDPDVILNAKSSTDWRVEMWKDVLPQVPHYLLIGKGLGMDAHDFEMSSRFKNGNSADNAEAAGDYHNGPLSLIMPFGIFGVFGFIWFLVASIRVLNQNCIYGDPALATTNRFFLAFFIIKALMFFLIFGSFYSDLAMFCGVVGMSIALNGGARGPVTEPVPRPTFNRFKLAGAAR